MSPRRKLKRLEADASEQLVAAGMHPGKIELAGHVPIYHRVTRAVDLGVLPGYLLLGWLPEEVHKALLEARKHVRELKAQST